jgi:polyketide cyclase/dehydrase/lipid transport protein
MINYDTDVIVDRPIEQVFRFMLDVRRYDDWTDMRGTHLVTGDRLQRGSQVQTTLALGPKKETAVFEVVEYEENRKLVWKTVSKGALEWDAQYAFEPQGASATHLISTGQIRLKGALKLTEPLMAGEIKNGEAKELVKLKELIEQSA